MQRPFSECFVENVFIYEQFCFGFCRAVCLATKPMLTDSCEPNKYIKFFILYVFGGKIDCFKSYNVAKSQLFYRNFSTESNTQSKRLNWQKYIPAFGTFYVKHQLQLY